MEKMIESQLRKQFLKEGLNPGRWSNGPGALYGAHSHPYAKVLMVVEGSIEFHLSQENRTVPMQTGDRLNLPPNTPHSAQVGSRGVVCLEAQLPSA